VIAELLVSSYYNFDIHEPILIILGTNVTEKRMQSKDALDLDNGQKRMYFVLLVLTVRLCIQETLNVCAWGTKYPHIQYQIFSTIGRGLLAELHVLVQQFKLNAISCSSSL